MLVLTGRAMARLIARTGRLIQLLQCPEAKKAAGVKRARQRRRQLRRGVLIG